MFNVKRGYPIKKALNIAPRGSDCEYNLWEVMAWESYPGGICPLTPASRLNGVVTLKYPYFTLIIGAMA